MYYVGVQQSAFNETINFRYGDRTICMGFAYADILATSSEQQQHYPAMQSSDRSYCWNYVGVRRKNAGTSKSVEVWRFPLADFCGGGTGAQKMGRANLCGLVGPRCWMDPQGRYMYALCLQPDRNGDVVVDHDQDVAYHFHRVGIPTAASSAAINARHNTEKCKICCVPQTLGLMRISVRGFHRVDFTLSAQPIISAWEECEHREHMHFVSPTEIILAIGHSEVDLNVLCHQTVRTRLYMLRIDEVGLTVHVNGIELPEPLRPSVEHSHFEDRRIYVYLADAHEQQHNNGMDHSICSRRQALFYTLDWLGQMRVLDEQTRQWTAFSRHPGSDDNLASASDIHQLFTPIRFDRGLLLDLSDGTSANIRVGICVRKRIYRLRTLFSSRSLVSTVDPRGTVCMADSNLLFFSPPLVMPLCFLAYWKLLQLWRNSSSTSGTQGSADKSPIGEIGGEEYRAAERWTETETDRLAPPSISAPTEAEPLLRLAMPTRREMAELMRLSVRNVGFPPNWT